MIRLLMGITLSEVGGSQKVVYNIISNLPEEIYDITLVTSPKGELLDWVEALNDHRNNKIQIVTLNCIRRDLSPIYDLITFVRLIRLMKKEKYNIAHFHNSKMGMLGRMAAKIAGVSKIFYTMHGLNLNKNTTGRIYPILNLLEKIVARFSTKVTFVSKYDMEIGIRNGWATKANACLIYNGMPESVITGGRPWMHSPVPGQEHATVIVFVARLAEPKLPEFAIQVSAKLLTAGYDHTLIIIGDGPKMESCKNLIHSLGIQEHVRLLGKCDNVMGLLAKADIFCLFSRWEGLPISVIEAMQCGLPVIASNVGGIPELVKNGESGFLVPGFSEDLAVEYLKELICDKEKRKRLGRLGRMMASTICNMKNMILKYRELYEAL